MKIPYPVIGAIVSATILLLLGLTNVFGSSERCEDAVSTAEMRECVNQRYTTADFQLDDVYERLSSEVGRERRMQLDSAQKAWITFRDKHAAFVAGAAEGGTLYLLLEISELATMTEQRTEQLKDHLQ